MLQGASYSAVLQGASYRAELQGARLPPTVLQGASYVAVLQGASYRAVCQGASCGTRGRQLRCVRAPVTVRCLRELCCQIWYFRAAATVLQGASYSAVLQGASYKAVLQGARLQTMEREKDRDRDRERERERSLCEQVMWNGSIYIGTPCAVMYIGAHCSLHTAQLVQVLDSRASQCSQWLPGSKLTVQKRRPAKSRLKAQSRKLAQNVLAGQEQPRQKVYPDGESEHLKLSARSLLCNKRWSKRTRD